MKTKISPLAAIVLLSLVVGVYFASSLLAKTVNAAEYEVGVGYNQVNINWIAQANFKVDMATIELTTWWNVYGIDVGVRSQYGKSDTALAETTTTYANSQATIESFTTVQLVARKDITNTIAVDMGYGSMNYDQSVTNFYEEGYSNSDSGMMWSVGVSMKLSEAWSVRYSYSMLHDKTKTQDETPHFLNGDGHESTSTNSITLVYLF